MNIKQAIGILQIHNKWRRGCDIEPMTNPTTLGIAIDTVIEHVKNNFVSDDVIKCQCNHKIEDRFPTELLMKECEDCNGVL